METISCAVDEEPFGFIKNALASQPLFAGKTWRLSPEPWRLSEDQAQAVQCIGTAVLSFYKAQDLLYRRSWEGKSLLRNRALYAPWVAAYLDRGKPGWLIDCGRSRILKGKIPAVIRPDLLLTEEGFALTELDSVPGGIGLTAYLGDVYGGSSALGFSESMTDAFYRALTAGVESKHNPVILAVVSDESETYRPEFQWLAEEFRKQNRLFYCCHPNELSINEEGVFYSIEGVRQRVDLVYRFFELFDLDYVPQSKALLMAEQKGHIQITPPVKTYQEEKLNLALFHHPELVDFWKEALSEKDYLWLNRIIPQTWIVEDIEDLPASAFLWAPQVNSKPIRDWRQLSQLGQKERQFILKASGFDETAWGSRSVSLGSDLSQEDWAEAIEEALKASHKTLYVMQDFKKPKRVVHPAFEENGVVIDVECRLRLCPYYFVSGNDAQFSGALATLCPAEKKIIHGMTDAMLIPVKY